MAAELGQGREVQNWLGGTETGTGRIGTVKSATCETGPEREKLTKEKISEWFLFSRQQLRELAL